MTSEIDEKPPHLEWTDQESWAVQALQLPRTRSSTLGTMSWEDLRKSLHKEVFLESKQPFRCPDCNATYACKASVNRHIKYECGNKEPCFQCPYCPKRCRLRSNLYQHARLVHNKKLSSR
ncbi:longitudinals lacking protein isoform X2 [Bemisia tabaci]|nr:PREDICTED: longitudinals lacking protein-like isoform X2 [Bemisia tabaci]